MTTATDQPKPLTPTQQNAAAIQAVGDQVAQMADSMAAIVAMAQPKPATAELAIGGVEPTTVKLAAAPTAATINRQAAAVRKQLDPNRPALPTLGTGTVPRTNAARPSTSPFVVADLPEGAVFGKKGLRDQHYATGPDKVVICEFPDGSTISRIQCFVTTDPADPVAPMETYFQLEFHSIGSRGRDNRIGGGAMEMILWLVEQVTGQTLTEADNPE